MDRSEVSGLVVDDAALVISSLTFLLEKRGHRFVCVSDVAGAMTTLAARHFDAVLLDMYLPDGEGLSVLDRALECAPPPSVLLMTARAEIRSAVEAMRRGAADYLEKPLDLDDLSMRLDRAFANATLVRKLAAYEGKHQAQHSFISKRTAMK